MNDAMNDNSPEYANKMISSQQTYKNNYFFKTWLSIDSLIYTIYHLEVFEKSEKSELETYYM